MRGFRLALQFLTILPVEVEGELPPETVRASLAWFPAVGLLIGGVLAFLPTHVWPAAPDRLSCLLVVATGILLTGALHLDGLADMADALCARKDREGRLAVMKDPRVGAAGAAAISLAVLLRWELLSGLTSGGRLTALLLAPAVGRAAMVGALRLLPPARPDGLVRLWGPAPWPAVVVSLLLAVALPLFIQPLAAFKGLVGAALAAGFLLAVARKAFGGLTGDVCGAVGELAELAFLMGFLGTGRWGPL